MIFQNLIKGLYHDTSSLTSLGIDVNRNFRQVARNLSKYAQNIGRRTIYPLTHYKKILTTGAITTYILIQSACGGGATTTPDYNYQATIEALRREVQELKTQQPTPTATPTNTPRPTATPCPTITSERQLSVRYSNRIPTIDGFLKTTEWDDSTVIIVQKGADKLVIFTKHNMDSLFVGLDIVTDQTSGPWPYGDRAFVAIDYRNNGGTVPRADDYIFGGGSGHEHFRQYAYKGTGENWVQTAGPPPYGVLHLGQIHDASQRFTISFEEQIFDHRTYEYRIPLNLVGNNPTVLGMYIGAHDGTTGRILEWPKNSGGRYGEFIVNALYFTTPAPDKWGKISLENKSNNSC